MRSLYGRSKFPKIKNLCIWESLDGSINIFLCDLRPFSFRVHIPYFHCKNETKSFDLKQTSAFIKTWSLTNRFKKGFFNIHSPVKNLLTRLTGSPKNFTGNFGVYRTLWAFPNKLQVLKSQDPNSLHTETFCASQYLPNLYIFVFQSNVCTQNKLWI